MRKLLPFSFLISNMCFICFRFYLLCIKLESIRDCLWGKQCHDAIHSSRNLETVFAIHDGSFNAKILVLGSQLIILTKTRYLDHIMVFGVVTSDADVMPPFIFQQGLRLNTESKTKSLAEVDLPKIRRMAAGRSYF